jgi:hypothetical protein
MSAVSHIILPYYIEVIVNMYSRSNEERVSNRVANGKISKIAVRADTCSQERGDIGKITRKFTVLGFTGQPPTPLNHPPGDFNHNNDIKSENKVDIRNHRL